MTLPTQFFSARATNGSSATFQSLGDYITLVVSGTFGGATLTVEVSADGGTTWVTSGVTATAAGAFNFIIGQGLLARLTLSGVTTTSVNAHVAYCK